MSYKSIIRVCAVISGVSGFVIFFSTIFPIIIYEWESNLRYPMLISPLAAKELENFGKDLTKASNWFVPSAAKEDFVSDNIQYFTLSIPKLKINNATVAINGEDLSKHLIQYPGTALPGKVGNAVIFGHSVLPLFYNPEDYMTIFSTLNRLEENDLVYTNYDGITYTYKVETLFEVRPEDVQILEQNSGSSYLTLVTCSPPGDPRKLKRLIVRARLVPFSDT